MRDSIAEALGLEPDAEMYENFDEEAVGLTTEEMEAAAKEARQNINEKLDSDVEGLDIKGDAEFSRKKLRAAIEKAGDMLPGLVALAKIAESPNIYNSASGFLDSFAKLNQTLIDLQIKVEKHSAVGTGGPKLQDTPVSGDVPLLESSGTQEPDGSVTMSTDDFLDMVIARMDGKKKVEIIQEVRD